MQPDQLVGFEENGFAVVRGLFTTDEVEHFRRQIDVFASAHQRELAARNEQGVSRANEISFTQHLAARDREIFRLVSDPRVLALAMRVLGPDVGLYWDQAVYKLPETRRDFPWHQDNGYTPVVPERYLTAWMPLGDVDVESGCIWVLPGSHLRGPVEHHQTPIGWQGYFGDDPGIPVPMKQGDLLVFSSLLLHRSGPNVSRAERKAFIMQYTPVGALDGRTNLPLQRPRLTEGGRPLAVAIAIP